MFNNEIIWLLNLIKPFKWQALLGSILVALTILFNIGLLATAAVLLSKAAFQPPILWLMTWIVGVRFFGLGRALLRYVERLINHQIAFNILGKLRADVYKLMEPLIPDPLEGQYDKAKLYNRMTSHIEVLQYFYLRVISVPLGAMFVVIVVGSILYRYSAVLSIGFITLYASLIIFMPLILARLMNGRGKKINEQRDKLTLNFFDFCIGKIDYALSGKLDERGNFIIKDFQKLNEYYKQSENIELWANRFLLILSHLSMLLTLYLTSDRAIQGSFDLVFYPALALMVLASFEGLAGIPNAAKSLDYSSSAAKELCQLESYHVLKNEGKEKINLNLIKGDIKFKNLFFSYHQKENAFIKDLSLNINYGDKIAFVGLSGSGKTTVAKLIMNLWSEDKGERYLGQYNYNDISQEALWCHIGMLEQKPYFFNTSIRENLLLASPSASDNELWHVLMSVKLDKKIKSLKNGLDEVLGENGTGLSGGEKTRLALARLVLRNPSIVILDEPYRGLDEKTKNDVSNFIQEWSKGKTQILITHEFNHLEDYDTIYIFKAGKIIENGDHNTLMRLGGEYQKFYDLNKIRI